ncbi:ATP-binding protein [Microbacterium sp. NPDC055988]|uniref:ATP-binding protein n=1 Tax=Microbacterium sp. NPDC055988 TaxID=3345671 RepID=UPI0035D92746
MQTSPYTPGEVADSVPGRATQLAFYEEKAQRIQNLSEFIARVRVDYAARGVGKTSLLREAERIFARHGIAAIWVTANQDENLLLTVLDELRKLVPTSKAADVLSYIDSATLTLDAGVVRGAVTVKPKKKDAVTAAASSSKAFIAAFENVTRVLLDEDRKGLVILIDEIQSADKPSLRAIAYAWQEMKNSPSRVPAGLFSVGLPGSQDHINSAVTFSERFDFSELFGLDDGGVVTALAEPAHNLGASWERTALQMAVSEARGYAYKVQLIGDEAWKTAGYPDPGSSITVEHLTEAMPQVEVHMETLFRSRWRSASPKQRELLSTIAELGGRDVKREDIAARLGVTTQAISMARDGLLRRGIIDANRHGRVSFTVPGFTEWILAQS